MLTAWHCEKTSSLYQDNGVRQSSITGVILCVIITSYACRLPGDILVTFQVIRVLRLLQRVHSMVPAVALKNKNKSLFSILVIIGRTNLLEHSIVIYACSHISLHLTFLGETCVCVNLASTASGLFHEDRANRILFLRPSSLCKMQDPKVYCTSFYIDLRKRNVGLRNNKFFWMADT